MPLYVLPDAGVAPIERFIEAAQGPIIINNYFIDNRQILAAIRDKVEEGAKVYLILEPHPYGISSEMVEREYEEARGTGAYVVDAPSQFTTGYVFDHAKYAVAQNEALIGTANWDGAAFRTNREFLYVTHNPAIVRALEDIGVADIKQVAVNSSVFPADLTVSPGAAPELVPVLQQPGPIFVEAEELQPGDPLFSALQDKGSLASVILPEALSYRENEAVQSLMAAGVHVRELPKYPIYIHSKIIVGQTEGWLGSQNFSTTSLDDNREVGIILHDAGDLAEMQNVFQQDWANGQDVGG